MNLKNAIQIIGIIPEDGLMAVYVKFVTAKKFVADSIKRKKRNNNMNITISTKTLAGALAELAPIAARKTAVMVLNNIKFVIKAGRARLQASDGETTVRKYISLDSSDCDGEFLVNGTDINTYVSAIRSDICLLEVSDTILTVQGGKSKAKFPVFNSAEFFEPVMPEDVVKVNMPATILKAIINAGSKFVSTDIMRPHMRPIRAIVENSFLTFCATDTRKLITDTYSLGEGNPDTAWNIEQNAFGAISKACNGGADMDVNISESIVSYRCGDNMVFTVQTKGKYPEFQRVIPRTHTIDCEISRGDVSDALRRMSPFAEASRLVKLSLTGMEATLQTCNIAEGKEASDSMLCTCNGDITIGLHADHFSVCLGAVDSSDMLLELTDRSRPVVVKDKSNPNRVIVFMPMNIG